MAIRETSDGGRPIVVTEPESPQARAYLALAEAVRDRLRATSDKGARAAPTIRYE